MRTFETSEPISVSVEFGVGDVRIEASDRADIVVDVQPSKPRKKADVTAAAQTEVDFTNEQLTVRGPRGWRQWMPHRGGESIDVRIELPSGSRLRTDTAVAGLRCTGRLGECRAKTGVGDIQLDEVGALELKTGAGDITVGRTAGKAEIVTGSGAVRIRSVDGAAAVKNSNGDTWIGEVSGEARVSAANGTISIDVAHGGVVAKTANGDVRVGEVARGAAVAQSAFGEIEIGVRDGVPAWLDLHTSFGAVQNDLETSDSPGAGEETVEVRASTSYGDIVIRRSSAGRIGREAS